MSTSSRRSLSTRLAGHGERPRTVPGPGVPPGVGADLRLFLAEAPGGDAEAVAAVLEACHGFTRYAVPPAPADGPCARASSARAAALARVVAWAADTTGDERVVVTGVACAMEARVLQEQDFCGIAVASTRIPVVCTVTGRAGPWQEEALRRPGRLPAPAACGHGAVPVRYVLDTGRDSVLAREHITTLVAVLDTLRYLADPAASPHRGSGRGRRRGPVAQPR